jgi:hypothetical protein
MGINPEYFLDEMSCDEIVAIYRAKYDHDKLAWEQTRLICFYNVIASNGTKTYKKPTDLFSFAWEKKKSKALTKEQVLARLNGKK